MPSLDASSPGDRRFGALFNLRDAVSGYGGGEPTIGPLDKDDAPE